MISVVGYNLQAMDVRTLHQLSQYKLQAGDALDGTLIVQCLQWRNIIQGPLSQRWLKPNARIPLEFNSSVNNCQCHLSQKGDRFESIGRRCFDLAFNLKDW